MKALVTMKNQVIGAEQMLMTEIRDSDSFKEWVKIIKEFKEAISELEAFEQHIKSLEALQAPKTCEGCEFSEYTNKHLLHTCRACCRSNLTDLYKPKETQC